MLNSMPLILKMTRPRASVQEAGRSPAFSSLHSSPEWERPKATAMILLCLWDSIRAPRLLRTGRATRRFASPRIE